LILGGNDDPVIPMVNARIMQFLLPRASLHIYDDGQRGLVTKADELSSLLSSFLRRVP
jgi:pimeloyl-ACP methyl ester carboxylesterase